ncbi:MAG TPA: DNA polymerase III subunit delta [Bacteroidia bacterium]|nr:DNA polymerase III subunit delta [Bacteroidia bacterium]HNT79731.1 DNA polymerase III subunit delta [Bacteroidia bacterium]
MPVVSYTDISRNIRNKIYHPVYLLHGTEPYFIDQISHQIQNEVLEDHEKEFNTSIVYGKDLSMNDLVSHARRYPMMSNFQMVIVREAQDLSGFPPKDDSHPLFKYIENPLSSTLLIFCFKYKKLDKRSKFYKSIEKKGIVLESDKLYDDKIPAWATEYLKMKNIRISPKAALLACEHLGNDLSKISNELDKVLINIPKDGNIDVEEIEKYIGISKEYNVFELQNAIGKKDFQKTFKILKYFESNQKEHPFVVNLTILHQFFVKLMIYHSLNDKSKQNVASAIGVHPFFVSDYTSAAKKYSITQLKNIFHLLHEYDLKSKGVENVSSSDGELMKEMVSRIMYK